MGSAEGVRKVAAGRVGLGVGEYVDRLNKGLLRCWRCQDWHTVNEFGKDSSRSNGRSASCRRSIAAARGRKNPERPGRLERDARRTQGQAWCRGCADWLPVSEVRQGVCREHAAEQYRRCYAANPGPIRRRASARKRGLDPIPHWWRERQFTEFGGLCAYGCGHAATTHDHIFPVAKGGRSRPCNLVPACLPCNSSKKVSDPYPWIRRGLAAFPEQWTLLIALDYEHSGSIDVEDI